MDAGRATLDNDVFGDRRLVADSVAHGDPARHRGEIDLIDPGRDALQQLEPRRWRKIRAPAQADDDVGLGKRRGKTGRVGVVGDDFDVGLAVSRAMMRGAWPVACRPRNTTFMASPCACEESPRAP